MASFRVDIRYLRTKTFYVEAENVDDVEGFLDSNPGFDPSDVSGLVERDDSVANQGEDILEGGSIVANFRITPELELVEAA